MNWFESHLNQTYAIAYVLTIAVRFLIVAVSASDIVFFIFYIVGALFMLGVSGWVIQQKGRSLWWILLFGFFSPLWLSNMAQKYSSGGQLKF